jgi:predicted RNA binding protein YcfA (HicA-like mRNA interferase family)
MSSRKGVPPVTTRELLKILSKDGWTFHHQTGSHMHYRHPTKAGTVTVPERKGDIPPGTLASIKRQAGLK